MDDTVTKASHVRKPDRGYAWLVLLGAFFTNIISGGNFLGKFGNTLRCLLLDYN